MLPTPAPADPPSSAPFSTTAGAPALSVLAKKLTRPVQDVLWLTPCPYAFIKGPGHARRAPHGTPYRSAGTILRRTIDYDGSGRAVLRVQTEKEDGTVVRTESTNASGSRVVTRHGSSSPHSPGGRRSRTMRNAAVIAAERAIAAEQEALFTSFMNRFPLLRVVPPGSLVEQRYVYQPVPQPRAGSVSGGGNGGGLGSSTYGGAAAPAASGRAVAQRPAELPTSPYTTLADTIVDSGMNVVILIGNTCDENNTLRALTWGGCRPELLRAVTWRLLSDYAPASVARQRSELLRKRGQYAEYTRQYFNLTIREYYEPALAAVVGGSSGTSGTRRSVTEVAMPSSPLSSSSAFAGGSSPAVGSGTAPAGAPSSSMLSLPPHERGILSQIALDMPRHASPIFHCERPASSLARCLFLWSQRHPAVGYVQGMDDIVAVFYHVFLADALRQRAIEVRMKQQERSARRHARAGAVGDSAVPPSASSNSDGDRYTDSTAEDDEEGEENDEGGRAAAAVERQRRGGRGYLAMALSQAHSSVSGGAWSEVAVSTMPREALDAALDGLPSGYLTQVEADTYWCAGRVLSSLQDNFTPGQPGIVKCARRLDALLRTADAPLAAYMEDSGIGVMAGCFQWLHCLLARELPLHLLVRLWDTYLAIGVDELLLFHVYVCTAIILSMRKLIMNAPMDVLMQMMKNPFSALFPIVMPAKGAASPAESRMQKKQEDWLDMVIADAYRLWRLHPPQTA